MELRGKTIEKERIAADASINKEPEPVKSLSPIPQRRFTQQEINGASGDD
jgi:hypothetical protein